MAPGGIAGWLLAALAATVACRGRAPGSAPADAAVATRADGPPLRLVDYAPVSRLHAEAHQVPRARFAVVDFHQHVNDHLDEKGQLPYPPQQLLPVMDAANVRTLVVLTGPSGAALSRLIETLVKPHPGRFVVFTQVDWRDPDAPDFGALAAQQLRADVARGARGLKVLKELGLYARDRKGRLVAIDDPRFDPIWRAAGELGVPVAIHSGDPEAFFDPPDARNERYEELASHPDWSFVAAEFPRLPALLAAQARVFARHPKTTFVALHVGGWPENLDHVSALLARHPNVHVELGARQAELGRQPRRARRFFLQHADRILFGTDFWPEPAMYANWFRWLETADEYFPYFNAPEQGRWNIYGLELPDEVLRKVYGGNAQALLGSR